jgi:GT2 family glycosyltransferase/glycosyltransferase involved in cell wall biosynthesis
MSQENNVDKKKEPSVKSSLANSLFKDSDLSGYIERVRGSFMYGWAAHEKSDAPIELLVLCGEKVIGMGHADVQRNDLKAHGIHDGKHGFKISLDLSEVYHKHLPITLKDARTLREVRHKSFTMKKETLLTALFNGIEQGHIKVKLYSDDAIGIRIVTVIIDEEKELHVNIDTQECYAEMRFLLPLSVVDSKPHLYQLIVEDHPVLLATDVQIIEPFKTAWQYLKSAYNAPGVLSMPSSSGHRYESLKFQLDAIAKGLGISTLEQITQAHDIVCQSYEGRKSFPSLSLPKFDKPLVSIVLPAYNKFEITYHCIASIILSSNTTPYEVILADDCSTDETVEAESIIENLLVSRNTENLRFLRNCNKATDLAKGKYIVFLNNDTEVTSFWLDELVNILEKDTTVGMTGSKLLNSDGSLQEAGGIVWENGRPWNVGRNANPYAPEYNYVRHVDYSSGAAMCIRADVWLKVDKFSEALTPCYFEDTDLAFKVRDAGYSTLYTPFSQVIHFEGQSHGTDVTQGLKKNQSINQKIFARKWFEAYKHNGKASTENLLVEKDRKISRRILVINFTTPQPNIDAGSYAAFQEMKVLISLGFKVTFIPDNLAYAGEHTRKLQALGVEVLYSPFYTSVTDAISKRINEMDAVYMTRYVVAEKYIETIKQLSNVKIIFNNADLHFLRELRSALKNDGNDGNEGSEQNSRMLERAIATRDSELAVCKKVDAILCYNPVEHAVISSHILNTEKLHITPWVLEDKATGKSFADRHGIAFLGGFGHFPNGEAVEFLLHKVMPKLTTVRPDICLYVYGSNMPEEYKALESNNIKMVGYADHLDDVFHEHRVFVAPLLSGAGIKGKVLESMAYQLPCVLTEIAAEGTGLTHGISAMIANTAEDFVDNVIKVYDDAELWQKLAENELLTVQNNYTAEGAKTKFAEIFASVGIYTGY